MEKWWYSAFRSSGKVVTPGCRSNCLHANNPSLESRMPGDPHSGSKVWEESASGDRQARGESRKISRARRVSTDDRSPGIAPFPIYQCRHTFATRLAGLGVSDTIIDQLLGHSPRGVLRFYAARVPEYLRDAVNPLEKMRSAKTEPAVGSKVDVIEDRPARNPNLIN
jgi:hypothetical protein